MSDRTSFYPELAKSIAPAQGKLAVLLPGLGAVSTTLIAGVHLIRKGLAQPFGSVTQMQKLRLGKRTQPRYAPVKELVPLADLNDLVFGGWDIFPDNTYEAAVKAGVLPGEMLVRRTRRARVGPADAGRLRARLRQEPRRPQRQEGRHQDGSGRGAHGRHRSASARPPARRARSWCGAARPRSIRSRNRCTRPLRRSRRACRRTRAEIPPSMIYAYAAIVAGIPYANGAPNLSVDVPALVGAGARARACRSPARTSRPARPS